MSDRCQVNALLQSAGKAATDRAAILERFIKIHPLCETARGIHLALLQGGVSITLNCVRSRITELTEAGLLQKADQLIDEKTQVLVNAWSWTGRFAPFQREGAKIKCEKCEGKGFYFGTVPVNENQRSFLK